MFWSESEYFCKLGAHAKFQNHMTTPSGRKANSSEERERKKREREIMLSITATSLARWRTHSARTNFKAEPQEPGQKNLLLRKENSVK